MRQAAATNERNLERLRRMLSPGCWLLDADHQSFGHVTSLAVRYNASAAVETYAGLLVVLTRNRSPVLGILSLLRNPPVPRHRYSLSEGWRLMEECTSSHGLISFSLTATSAGMIGSASMLFVASSPKRNLTRVPRYPRSGSHAASTQSF